MRLNRKAIAVLSAGHMINDLAPGSLVILLPLIKTELGLTYAATALVMTLSSFSGSLSQPVFGLISDRVAHRWLLPFGVALGGVAMSLTGLLNSYELLVLVVVVSGLGVAAFHPEGAKNARYASGPRRATGMSLFSIGGNAGMALGSVLLTPLLVTVGRSGTLFLAVPSLLMALALWRALPRLRENHDAFASRAAAPSASGPSLRSAISASLLLLVLIVCFRSATQVGLQTFLPLYWRFDRGFDTALASVMVFLYLASGAAGTLVGGPLADRFGNRKVLVASLTAITPLLLLFLRLPYPLAMIVLMLTSMTLVSTMAVTVVMAQELAPEHTGIASGMVMGFAWGLGGLASFLLGIVADAWGVPAVLNIIALLPIPAAVLAVVLLPKITTAKQPAMPSAT